MNVAASNAFRTIALIGKYQSREIAESLLSLAAFLSARGVEVLLEEATAAAVGANGYVVAGYETIGERADVAVILGGDGTMLNAARHLARFEVPLVGINQGRLGFMTDISLGAMTESISAMLEESFSASSASCSMPKCCATASRLFRRWRSMTSWSTRAKSAA